MTRRHNINVALALVSLVFFPVAAFAQTPRVAAPAQFALGASPNALTYGDFNGDGFQDVASANSGFPTNTVSVLLNDGTGKFGSAIITNLNDYPLDMASADFNGDSSDDLVVGQLSGVRLLLSNGNGTFTNSTPSTLDNTSVATGDFNADGTADFAVAYYSFPNGHVQLFFGQGNGAFNPPLQVAEGSWDPSGLLASDLESDGDLDLVFFDFVSVWALLNNGTGSFGAPVQSTNTGGFDVALGDFNGDGKLDATSVDASGGNVGVSLGDGAGHFTFATDYPVIDSQGLYVATGDFNADGRVDIAAGDDNDIVVLLRGRGDGAFVLLSKYLHGGYHLLTTDVNNDGRADLLGDSLVSNELTVGYGSRQGLVAPTVQSFASLNDFLELGDVNGDGRLDAVASGSFAAGLEVLLNRGNGRMAPPIVSSTTHQGRALALGDLNSDGKLDAVVGSVPVGGVPNLEVLLGDGTGRFMHMAELDNGSAAAIFGEALALADMNLDGKLDILSNTFTSISVRPGNGNGTFGAALVSGVGNGASSVLKVRDFNADGIPDVVTVADSGNNDDARSTVYLNLGTGNGAVTFQQSFTIDARIPQGDSADLNGDGLPDLAITGTPGAHTGRGGMFVALNVGGSFGPVAHYDAAAISLALGDLNGDAHPEAVLTSLSTVEVWVNNGDGTFGSGPLVLSAPDSAYEVELGNLFGSPQLDLAVLGSAIHPSKLVLYQNLAR